MLSKVQEPSQYLSVAVSTSSSAGAPSCSLLVIVDRSQQVGDEHILKTTFISIGASVGLTFIDMFYLDLLQAANTHQFFPAKGFSEMSLGTTFRAKKLTNFMFPFGKQSSRGLGDNNGQPLELSHVL